MLILAFFYSFLTGNPLIIMPVYQFSAVKETSKLYKPFEQKFKIEKTFGNTIIWNSYRTCILQYTKCILILINLRLKLLQTLIQISTEYIKISQLECIENKVLFFNYRKNKTKMYSILPFSKQEKSFQKNQQLPFSSSVKIIGYYPPIKKLSSQTQSYMQTLQFDLNAKSFIPNSTTNANLMKSSLLSFKVQINPIQIAAQGNTLGIIDQNHNAWIMSQIFQSPVNLSLLLKKRATQIFINEKQIILKTKKGLILVNWGSKKLFQNQSLIRMPIYDSKTFYQNFFEAFSILDGSSDDIFLISNMKKSQNSNKMYRIMNQGKLIYAYPTMEKLDNFQAEIVGLSVGKYHAHCWDCNGSLYSWGTRSLALGFKNLPDEDLTLQPKKLDFNFKVKSCFASTHYSLALGTDGKLYQWGIKKQVNQINQQLIFQPRSFVFKYFKLQNKKFTCLKGKNNKFGILCSSGDLYVWGQKTRIFVDPLASIPKQWQNGRLYEPYLVNCPKQQKIIDFFIEQNFLSLVTIPKSCKYLLKSQAQYWDKMKESVRNKFNLKKYRKVNTEANFKPQNSSIRFSAAQSSSNKQNFMKSLNLARQISLNTNRFSEKEQDNNMNYQIFVKSARQDRISKAQYIKKSKQKYLGMAQSQDKLFSHIMRPLKNQKYLALVEGPPLSKRQYKKSNAMLSTGLKFLKRKTQAQQLDNQNLKRSFFQDFKNKIDIPQFLRDLDQQKVEKIKKKRRDQHKKLMTLTASEGFMKKCKDNKPYILRLQEVLEKKKNLQSETFNQTMKKLEQNSLQFRMKRHMQIQMSKQRQKHHQLLKNTLFKFLIKNYIVKLFGAPLAIGREIKIQNFARNLKFQRIEKNIRKLFVKTKAYFSMKKLKNLYFSRFVLLTMQWKKYVKRFRQKKYLQKRRFVVEEITKYFIKDKIKLGLSTSNLNIRKIQKFREWIVLVKNQRIKCLKYLWRVHLFSIMKISPENQSVIVCHLPKNTQQITFQSLYNEKVQQNPNLKLETFLNKSPLFKIKVEYFRTVANLFTEQKTPLHKSQKIINYLTKSKKAKIKFLDNQQQNQGEKEQNFKINILNNDIFPYSVHYNVFLKPKNFDLAISQMMKKSQKWINQQKIILDKILSNIIFRHQNIYRKKSREYDLQLAHFIKSKYDIFCEKRWKFIIEYNQIQKSVSKKKKEKELLRIMDLIGMKKLLLQDCLPERQAILDEALKRKDVPKPPNSFIVFGQRQFKEIFRIYYDHVYAKIKQMRKIAIIS